MMHTHYPVSYPQVTPVQEESELNVFGLMDIMRNSRWLILSTTLLAIVASGIYVYVSPPIYKADTLIQIEQSNKDGSNRTLGELTAIFGDQLSTAAETEILKSRLVLGEAADALNLDISTAPNYLPILGPIFAAFASAPSRNLPALNGYVWGNEAIKVSQLTVPPDLENQPLTIVAGTAGTYTLRTPDGETLGQGKVGTPLKFEQDGSKGEILVTSMRANPAGQFTVRKNSRQAMIKRLQEALTITEKNSPSGMLDMSMEGTNPRQIANTLNAIGNAYVRQNVARKSAEAEKTLAFLDVFLPQLKQKLDTTDNSYTEFRDRHGTFNLTTEGELSLAASAHMQTQLFDLQQKRREQSAMYGPSHPVIVALDKQINAVKDEMTKLNARIKALPGLEQQLTNLSRDVKVNGDLYASLLNSRQQLQLIKEGKVGSVRVVDRAEPPLQPVKPQKALIVTIATLFGLLLGVGLAWLRSKMRPGIQIPTEIENSLGLSVYSTVPRTLKPAASVLRLPHGRHEKYVLAEIAPNDPAVESLRSLRTTLLAALQGAANTMTMVTSPTPNVGKTFTSVNLAAVLGAADQRILLIDSDFRGGHLHQYFGLDRHGGLTEMIHGEKDYEEVVHRNVLPNVDLITTGRLPHNPGEILMYSSVVPLLKRLAEHYDITLIDTAPVLAVSDALALAPHMGTVFMLARAQVSTLSEVDEAARRLRQAGAPITGVILNDFDANSHHFTMKYGGMRHSHYDYGYDYGVIRHDRPPRDNA